MSLRQDDTTTRDAALLGGGALVTYLLLRRLGGGSATGPRGTNARTTTATVARPDCDVFIDADGRYRLDGAPSDFATAVASCRAAGGAHVATSGQTRQGALDAFLRALLDAGVTRFGGPDIETNLDRVRATLGKVG